MSRHVDKLRCGGVVVCGSHGVLELHCGGVAVCGGRDGYQTSFILFLAFFNFSGFFLLPQKIDDLKNQQ